MRGPGSASPGDRPDPHIPNTWLCNTKLYGRTDIDMTNETLRLNERTEGCRPAFDRNTSLKVRPQPGPLGRRLAMLLILAATPIPSMRAARGATAGREVTDHGITAAVERGLVSPFVHSKDIKVAVDGGVATLTGTVGTWIGWGEGVGSGR